VGIGDLDVPLAARDDVHFDAGEVAEHDAAVVGRGEIGVGGGQLVGAGDHREPEALRGLAALQRLPARNRAHHPVLGDHDGVRGRHRDAGRLVHAQRGHAIRDDPLVDQGPGGVVQQHAALGRLGGRDDGQGRAGRVRPGHPALDDRGHLAVAGVGQHGLDLLGMPARHHDQDLVDPRRLVEGGHAPLEEGPAAQGQQLLGHGRAEPLPRAAAEHHRDHPHVRDFTVRFHPAGEGYPGKAG
jgi:hypothetical protein